MKIKRRKPHLSRVQVKGKKEDKGEGAQPVVMAYSMGENDLQVILSHKGEEKRGRNSGKVEKAPPP